MRAYADAKVSALVGLPTVRVIDTHASGTVSTVVCDRHEEHHGMGTKARMCGTGFSLDRMPFFSS